MISGFPVLTAAEAAALIDHDDVIGFGGFTPAGSPKAVSRELAARAIADQFGPKRPPQRCRIRNAQGFADHSANIILAQDGWIETMTGHQAGSFRESVGRPMEL